MPTISEIRRTNLRAVIDSDFAGVPARLAKALGCQQTSITRLYSQAESSRNMGDSLARRIEKAAGKPAGWMDALHDNDSDQLVSRSALLTNQERQMVLQFVDSLIKLRSTH